MATEQPFFQQIRNTANVTLDVVLAAVNTAIGVAYGQANTATAAASAAQTTGNQALSNAGGAYNQANTAVAVGQAAYAEANTAASAAASAASAASAAQTTANEGIAASGVTAGTYGTATAIPVMTVDARGRALSIVTESIPTFSTSTNGLVAAPGGSSNSSFLAQNGTFIVDLGGGNQSVAGSGWTTLPGGLILQWGSVSVTNGAGQSVSFNKGFPTACFAVTATHRAPSSESNIAIVGCGTPGAGSFTLYTSIPSGITVTWFAIGH